MNFDIEKARKQGNPDPDILAHLSEKHKDSFNFVGAKELGYSDADIIKHLAGKATQKTPPETTGDPLVGLSPVPVLLEPTPSMESYGADIGRPMIDAPEYVPEGVEPSLPPEVRPTKATWGEVALEAPIKSVVPSLGMMAGGLEIAGADKDLEYIDYTENQIKMGTFPGQEAELKKLGKRRDKILEERQAGIALFRGSKETMADIQPDVEYGTPKYYVGAALQSVAQMAPSLTASIATGNPLPTMTYMGMVSGGIQYGELIEAGIDPTTARYASLGYTLAEGIPEAFPVGVMLKGGKAFTRILKTMGAETAQEEVTEALQMAIDKGTLSPDMTWKEAKQRFKDVAIISPIAGGVMAGATQPFVGKAPIEPTVPPVESTPVVAPTVAEKPPIAKKEVAKPVSKEEFKGKMVEVIDKKLADLPPKKEVVPRGTKPKVVENGHKEKQAFRAKKEAKAKEELLKVEREAKAPEKLTRESVEKEEVAIKSNIAKLRKSQQVTLDQIQYEVENGEQGSRRKGFVVASTFPIYFQNKGYTKKETLRAIDKVKSGEELGVRQATIIEDLVLSARMEEAIESERLKPAKESVVTGELPKKPLLGDEKGEVSLEGIEDIPGRVKKAVTAVEEFFTPFSTIPQSKAYEELRYKTLGKLDRVEGVISKIWKRTKDLPSEQKKQLFDFLAGRIEKTALPLRLQPMAVSLRTQHNVVGKMLVKRGLMTEKTYEENKDSYVKFMYLKHLEGGVKGGGRGLKLGLSYQKGRMDATVKEVDGKYQVISKGGHSYSKPMTKEMADAKQKTVQENVEEYRRSIGLIEDISVAAPTGLASTLSDITKFDFMKEMSLNPEWVWQDSIVKVDGKRMGIGKLEEEIETQKKIVEQAPNVPEAKKRLDVMESAMAEVTAKTDKIPEDFVQLPVAKAYGDLSGAYIRKEIALDIQPVVRMFSDSTQFGKIVNAGIKAEEQLVAAFKVGKVALNPPTIARNILSNQIQLNMSGIPLYKLPMYWKKTAMAMKDKSQYYNEARRVGIFRTNWALTEIDEVLDTVKTMEKDGYAGIIGSIGKLAKFYGKIDDFFKLLKYIEQREGGASKGKASREAQKWVMDYSRATPSIKFARKHLLPMVTFQYKIVPLIAEALVKRPWVIAKYMMIPYLMQQMAKENLDIDDKEWEKLEKQLPKYVRESGVYTLYPVRSPEGNLQWVNLEYYVPWQGFIGLNQMVKKGDYGEMIGDVVRHPILDVITSFKTAKGEDPPKDTFTGRELYNRLDTPTDKALKTSEWLVSKWAPSAFTRRGAAHKSLQVAFPEHFGAKDDYGRKITKSQALGKWVGFNIIAPTPKQVMLERMRRLREVDRAIFKVIIKPTNSEEYKKQIRQAGKREKEKIRAYYEKGD